MVGDYAALVSLNFMIDQIQHSAIQFKPRLEHLQQKITSLQLYLENHTQKRSQDIQGLERRITHVCHDAEDVIESYVLDQILQKPGYDMKKSWSVLSDDLLKVVKELDSITQKAMENMDDKVNESQQPRNSTPGGPSRSAPSTENKMVGFDKHLIQVMGQITNQESKLQILPIVGMGGIGKSTLARNVYENKSIVERFQIRLWGTISQSYDVQDILASFLNDLGIVDNINLEQVSSVNKTIQEVINDLGLKLYQALYGRTYLIVVDDIWSVDAWISLRKFFPSVVGDGSRIIVTTRLSSLVSHIGSNKPYELEFLDKDESWNLLRQKVFAEDKCPSILEDIGKDIAISCRGLPLALVVIAGQLAKSDMTKESWEHVAGSLNSIVNSDDNGYVLKVLSLSFDNLPVHLKPCFLYMGVFRDDSEVCISSLIKLWLAEGFLKPGSANNSLEDNAMEYLTDLIERNLIFISKRGSSGKMKCCRIHDLLRDVCLSESQRHKFLCSSRFGGPKSPHGIETKILYAFRSTSLTISDLKLPSELNVDSTEKFPSLLRSRCLTLSANWEMLASLSPLATLSMLWSLQTFILSEMPGSEPIILPCQIWEMTLLRHLEIQRVVLPDPPHSEAYVSEEGPCILKNLQTLLYVQNFKLSEEVVKRIPNIKKLKLTYREAIEGLEWQFYRLENLGQLCKLETLSCSLHKKISAQHISFPRSLKKLTLDGGEIPWEDMKIIGSLPNLEVLRLQNDAFVGTEWIPVEDEFCQLKLLHLQNMSLEKWEADKNHFPKLETLILTDVWGIEELPIDIGDIATLTLITLEFCSSSLVKSARQLQHEQEESMGNYDIKVREDRTSNAIEQVLELGEYLQQSKDILDGLIKGQTKDENLEKFLRQVQDKVYEAEDFIDTFVTRAVEIKSMNHFQKFMHKVVENINFLSITKQVKEMCSILLAQHNYGSKLEFTLLNGGHGGHHHIYKKKAHIAKLSIVGFEDESERLINHLTEEKDQLDVISIIGMPGLGKTTLATKIFHDARIRFEFPVCIWIDISQDFSMKNVCLAIIGSFRIVNDDLSDKTDQELAQIANDHLQIGKFLIIMDDVWTVEDWEKLKIALPISNCCGRVLITSRNLDVGNYANQDSHPHHLRFLTNVESWEHLQLEVFGEHHETPHELEICGRLVAEECHGIPLALSLIGGILAENVSVTECEDCFELFQFSEDW